MIAFLHSELEGCACVKMLTHDGRSFSLLTLDGCGEEDRPRSGDST